MVSCRVDVGGSSDHLEVHVETHGATVDPAVLYVHGGPGQGCYHFLHTQAALLSEHLHVVGVDHRGAMRSDPLPAHGPPLTPELVVADLEAVREHLGLERWTLIGHAAGAVSAVTYAIAHPDRVSGLVLDCPALDADLIDRWRLPIAADLLDEIGKPEMARRARALARSEQRMMSATYDLLAEQGDRRDDLFFATPAHARAFAQVVRDSGFVDEVWDRGASHAPLLADLYEPRLPLLGQVRAPMMLLRGSDDPVTPPEVVRAIERAPSLVRRVDLQDARHFPSSEQAEAYAEAVRTFVLGLAAA